MFVTAQGSALTRYRRALERRHIFGAEIAAKEMAFVSLRDALGLLALYAAEDSPKYGKAATRYMDGSRSSPTISSPRIYNWPQPHYRHCTVGRTRPCACLTD